MRSARRCTTTAPGGRAAITDSRATDLTGRNSAPSVISAAVTHASIAETGHQRVRPWGMPIFCPCPSWSVLERRKQHHTLAHVLDITDVQSDQLGASEPTHETDQQQGSVAHSLDISAVAEGIGVATVIDEGFFPEDRIVKLKSDGPPLASIVDVVYLANRRSNPLIADFIDMAKEIQHGG